jgi:hypothetical protein
MERGQAQEDMERPRAARYRKPAESTLAHWQNSLDGRRQTP